MKYRKINVLVILLFGLGLAKMSGQVQRPFEVKPSLTSNTEYHTTNYGIFGLDIKNAQSGFIVPRGSGKEYLFGSGLWFGAKKPVSHDSGVTFQEEKLTFICYNPNSGASWATPGEHDRSEMTPPILYRSSDYDRATGTSVVSDPKWPLWLLPGEETDPFFAGNFVQANHERTAGTVYEAPAFMQGVDEQFFARYHDKNLDYYETGADMATRFGYPLGLQIEQHVYSWNPGNAMQNVVILQYEVTNVSNDVLRDCYIAQAIDFDIGHLANDRMKFYDVLPGLHTGIAWTEQEQQEYGLLAMTMLEGPVTDANGFVDPDRRGHFFSRGEVGVLRNWVIEIDPRTPEERYEFMAAGVLDGDTGPGDKRALIGSKPFNMAPGDKAYFTLALAVLEGVSVNGTEIKGPVPQGTQIPELETLVQRLHEQYYVTGFSGSVSSATESDNGKVVLAAAVSPNPGADNALLTLTLAEPSDLRIRIIDNLGRTVRTEQLNDLTPGTVRHPLDLGTIPSGSYLVSVETGAEQRSLRLTVVR